MRPSRGVGILALTLIGVSGCAGMQQRGTTTSPMEAPAVSAPARQSGWRGWWSRWTTTRTAPAATPARVPAATFDPDLPIETSRRVGPEREIWPDQSRSPLSRLLPSGLTPTLGQNRPAPTSTMTPAEANRAIASLARPRKTADDFVLPVRMWDDAERPTLTPTPTFVDDHEASEPSEPVPHHGPFMERFSTEVKPRPKLDPDARNTSGADPAEAVGPPPLVGQAPDSDPALDLAAVAQTPPPPPVRPSPRVSQTPPAPAIEATSPAAPAVAEPAESGDEPSPPASPAEHTPEAPTASLPVAPPSDAAEAAVAPSVPSPMIQGPTPVVAASQSGWASGSTLVAGRSEAPAAHHWSLLKWFRPQQAEHRHPHHPGVFPSPQGPVALPPVLVPTSYQMSLAGPSGPPPSRQAFVMPSPQAPPTAAQSKKPCFLVTRLHERIDQYRQWKHAHICKHIQGLKDMLTGKNRCQACGGSGVGPIPSPQAPLTAPTPQAQSWSPFRPGL